MLVTAGFIYWFQHLKVEIQYAKDNYDGYWFSVQMSSTACEIADIGDNLRKGRGMNFSYMFM